MRPLVEEELQTVLKKLANYTGRSLNQLIQPPDDNERYVFRVQGSRVYYVKLSVANLATSIARDNLMSLGICLGKFTKTMKFRLHITAYVHHHHQAPRMFSPPSPEHELTRSRENRLDLIAPLARYKVWIKPNGVQVRSSNLSKMSTVRLTDYM